MREGGAQGLGVVNTKPIAITRIRRKILIH